MTRLELTAEDMEVLERAFTDAIDYREGDIDDDGADPDGCRDCQPGDACEDHAGDQALGHQYRELFSKIKGQA